MDDVKLFVILLAMVEALVILLLQLQKDTDSHAAVGVTSKPIKSIMRSVLLWHGRFCTTEPRPEHTSTTCFVFKAMDEHIVDSETIQYIKVTWEISTLDKVSVTSEKCICYSK